MGGCRRLPDNRVKNLMRAWRTNYKGDMIWKRARPRLVFSIVYLCCVAACDHKVFKRQTGDVATGRWQGMRGRLSPIKGVVRA